MLEVAHHLIDGAHNGERVGIFLQNGGKGGDLGLVDHADQQVLLLPVVHAHGGDQGGAVVEPMDKDSSSV